jgi:3-oxoacyl-(acyl-carrier-protein) synthase/acyl carrier protein
LSYVGKGAHIGKIVISHQVDRMIDCAEQCIERMLAQHQLAQRQPLSDSVFRLKPELTEASVTSARAATRAQGGRKQGPATPPENIGIAVIGMAGQFPQAADLPSFWRNIAEGRDCISEVPASRWSADDYYDADRLAPGKSYCKWMGVIEDADKFDPLFFSISPAEAKMMDPQQRLFLQACWHCIEDAGINPDTLSGTRCGVFAGCTQGLYGQSDDGDDLDAQGLMGGNSAILAARISYFLNLKGPSLAIDTACSSSLVAINEACNYLQLGKVDLALAGGVTVLAGPGLHIMTSKAGMLSPQGRCFTFDNKADGFVPGEGVGVVLLKNLARALEDGDPIHGVIRGWGVNQDGKTNGITAPSPGSQIQLQKQVYEEFGLSPDTITLVEAHGTGTKLGDPIEVGALIESFRASTTRQHYCALGSVKSNIGHTLSAAGVCGFIKILLALKHRQLPPTVQFKQLNEHIPLAGSPFVINTELRPWRVAEGAVRRAAVSSFSFSGTNAHLVVDEAPEQNIALPEQPACLIVLSARSPRQLREQAHQLAEYAATHQAVSLTSVSYTLLTGRKHFPHRLAAIVSNEQELEHCLREWLASGQSSQVLSGYSNEVEIRSAQALPLSSIEPADQRIHLRQLGERFCLGESLQPAQALAAVALSTQRLRRTALPGYPFAKESYWIGRASPAAMQPAETCPVSVRTESNKSSSDVVAGAAQKQWIFVAEKQVLDPLPKSMDWQVALRKVSAQRLLIVADDEDRSSLASLVTQLEKSLETAPGTSSGISVETVAYQDLSIEKLRAIPDAVIICGPSDRRAESPGFVDQDIRNVFDVCRLFMRKAWDSPIQFYYVYADDERNQAIDCEALSGLLSSAAMENSHHRWTLISCDRSVDATRRNQIILQEWLSGAVAESALPFVEVRHRDSQRWSTRLQAVDVEPGPQSIFRAKATYLITGGLGPMGMLLCSELARRYQARLVILSRSPLDEEQREKINALESLGASVHYFPVDITDQAALAATYRAVKSSVGEIHGVMLLANQVQDGIIANKTWESFAMETATKTRGTMYVDELTASEPLEFFLLFSSVAAYGLAGSAGYSYSSAFQNAFARYRNNLGKTGARSGFSLSCCWGPWTVDYYLRQANGEDRSKKFAAQGTDLITIEAAFPLIQSSSLVRRDALGMVAVRDAQRFSSLMMLDGRAAKPSVTKSAVCAGFAWFVRHLERWEGNQQSGRKLSIATVEETIPLEEIRKLPPDLIQRLYKLLQAEDESGGPGAGAETDGAHSPAEIVDAVAQALAAVLELQSVSHDEPFQNYGLDSIVAMKLVTRLERHLSMSIEPKWLIDFPTVRTLAAFLTTQESLKATT